MVQSLQESRYRLPESVVYNNVALPFAYPPLGFYLSAWISDIFGVQVFDVMRFFPLAVSILTLAAVFGLAKSLFQSRLQISIALYAFGVLPLAYRYFIMGAGITRSPGLLFAVLTVWQAYLLFKYRQSRFVFSTMLSAALTVLSHPNATWFALYSVLLLAVFFARHRRSLLQMIAVAIGVVILTAPWWGTVINRYSVSPFFAAPQSGNPGTPSWFLLLSFSFTDEPLLPLLAFGGLLGVLVCIRDRQWWLPTWLIASCILDTRYSCTFAMIPLALLVGMGVNGLFIMMMQSPKRQSILVRSLLSCVILWAFTYTFASTVALPGAALQALSLEQREAMSWIKAKTVKSSTFLVVAPAGKSAGSESEWFSVLAERASLGAYQGSEWLPNLGGKLPWERYNQLQQCGDKDVKCLDRWVQEGSIAFNYVYLRDEHTQILRQSLLDSPDYTLEYHTSDTWVFLHR